MKTKREDEQKNDLFLVDITCDIKNKNNLSENTTVLVRCILS